MGLMGEGWRRRQTKLKVLDLNDSKLGNAITKVLPNCKNQSLEKLSALPVLPLGALRPIDCVQRGIHWWCL